jgi:hypothetical protein
MGAMLSATLELGGESKFAISAAQVAGARFRPLPVDRNPPAIASSGRFMLLPEFATHDGWATLPHRLESGQRHGWRPDPDISSSGDPLPVTLNGVTSSTFG